MICFVLNLTDIDEQVYLYFFWSKLCSLPDCHTMKKIAFYIIYIMITHAIGFKKWILNKRNIKIKVVIVVADGCYSQREGCQTRDWRADHQQDDKSTDWGQESRYHLPWPVGATSQVCPALHRLLSAGWHWAWRQGRCTQQDNDNIMFVGIKMCMCIYLEYELSFHCRR